MEVTEFLSHLEKVKKTGKQWEAECPAHDDHEASLSVSVGDDGRVLVNCFAGCTAESIVAALGLSLKDLFPSQEGGGRGGLYLLKKTCNRATAEISGCSLAEYADAKGLPVAWLLRNGVSEMTYLKKPAVRIPLPGSKW
jgi:hypothetical protein